MGFRENFRISEKYIEDFKKILMVSSDLFVDINKSCKHDDLYKATDMVIEVPRSNIALRVRDYDSKYRDFTVRYRTKYGNKTEIDKLREGYCDWYVYGWADKTSIVEWIIIDLDRVREFGILDKKWKTRTNEDDVEFMIIPLGELEMTGCIVSKSLSEKTQERIDDYVKKHYKN